MDILRDISREDLPKLSEMYKNHTNFAPHVHSFINTAIKWKSVEKYNNLMTFMSPNNCWINDGTFIVLMQFSCYDVFVFTLENSCENLYNGLMQTKRIDFSRNPLFFSIQNDHFPTIKKVIKDRNLKLSSKLLSCHMFAISVENALKLTWEVPSEVYVKKLDISHVAKINSLWPHRYPNSEKYLTELITMNGGYGIFSKTTNELLSWILKHIFGHLGIVQTIDECKMKGYGSLVTKVLSKEIAQEGHCPFGTIIIGNQASVNMFQKLGFTEIGISIFMKIGE